LYTLQNAKNGQSAKIGVFDEILRKVRFQPKFNDFLITQQNKSNFHLPSLCSREIPLLNVRRRAEESDET